MSKEDVKVGDWVRFYRAGKLVMGVVMYIHKEGVLHKIELQTDNGAVDLDSVIEKRGNQ